MYLSISNKKILARTLSEKKGGTLDAMGVIIKVIFSLYEENIHITVPVYSKINTFWNYMFNVDQQFNLYFKTKQIKHGKNKVVGYKSGSINS